MKQILSFCMIVAMLSCLPFSVGAADAAPGAETFSVHRDEVVIVSLVLSEPIPARSGAVTLQYDPSVLMLASGDWRLEAPLLQAYDARTDMGVFAYGAEKPLSGVVFSATFRVKAEAALGVSAVSMTLQLRDGAEQDLPLIRRENSVTVVPWQDESVTTARETTAATTAASSEMTSATTTTPRETTAATAASSEMTSATTTTPRETTAATTASVHVTTEATVTTSRDAVSETTTVDRVTTSATAFSETTEAVTTPVRETTAATALTTAEAFSTIWTTTAADVTTVSTASTKPTSTEETMVIHGGTTERESNGDASGSQKTALLCAGLLLGVLALVVIVVLYIDKKKQK